MAEVPTRRDYGGYHPNDYDTATAVPSLLKRVSWGAIFAGTVVALGISIFLGLLGLAIGIGSINPGEEANPLAGLGTGTLIWWVITSLVALFVGGRVAGQLAGFPSRQTAMVHGLTVWALATFVTLWLATSAISTVAGGAISVVSTAARGVGSVAGAVTPAPGDVVSDQRANELAQQARQQAADLAQRAGLSESDAQEAQQVLQDTARGIITSPGDAGSELNSMIDALFRGEGAVVSPQERDRLVQVLANEAGTSPEEAQRTVDAWVAQSQTVGGEITDAIETGADDVTDALSAAAWGAFITSLLSMIAAIIGAATGAPKEPWLRVHHHENDEATHA